MQIELGIVTFEQVSKEMSAKKGGERINEIKLVRPTNKYENDKGVPQVNKTTDLVEDDFIIKEVQTEDKSKLFNGTQGEQSPNNSEADYLKGLFG
jgi:hypothetical protein